MSFHPYPQYKDSGVEWLGEVPAGWSLCPLKYVATCNDNALPDSTDDDYEIRYVEISDVNEVDGITGSTTYRFSEAPSRARRIVKDGDVLVSTVRTYLRAISPVKSPPENLIASTGFAAIRPTPNKTSGAFLGYLLRAEWWISEVISHSVGVSYPAINAPDLMAINVPVPNITEQTQIARFLDHETGKIDGLIAEQEQLIELLKEKRQATISHAVTKGLNPDVPMKDSGVEWLGEVPEHWDITRLGWQATKINSGKTPRGGAEVYQSSGVLFLRSQNIYDVGLRINDAETTFIDLETHSEMNNSKVQPGDVLLNITGASIGRTCLVPPSFPEANVNQHVCIIRLPKHLAHYTSLVLKSFPTKEQINVMQVGGNRESMNFEQIADLVFAIPPVNEQTLITEHLDRETTKLDTLLTEAQRGIELLKERRSALISAAVTGKIDVRNWQPQGEAA